MVLPDCRAYEQVSPVEKNYASAGGEIGTVRGPPSGEALTFSSEVPFPVSEGAPTWPRYLSTRTGSGWSTQGLLPKVNPGAILGVGVVGVTEDLSDTLVTSLSEPPLAPDAVEGRLSLYLRDNSTGADQLLAQAPSGEFHEFSLVGAADGDSRIFFETTNKLLPEAADERRNVYEWHEGKLSLTDVLPEGEGAKPPNAGAVAGAGPVEERFYVQGAVSEDGSRIFFTDLGSGRLYMRETQAGDTIGVSAGPAVWRAAAPYGTEAFYTEGGQLYRFELQGEKREPLTPVNAGVLGLLGIGGEGSYVYFAATAALASGASEMSGEANVYVWHEGALSYIATVAGGEEGDESDWESRGGDFESGGKAGPAEGGKSSRITPDGQTLMFASKAQLTGYRNAGHYEVYRYSAATGQLSCVSCNPSGAAATTGAFLDHEVGVVGGSRLSPEALPRFLSEDGARVFFESEESLLPRASQGEMNVYEWEESGSGSCQDFSETFSNASDGCIFLISGVDSEEPSYFAEASASGDNVFFFTRQSLVGQDTDELVDVYDASVGGGFAGQNPPAPPAPCAGETCRGAASSSPSVAQPLSEVFLGPGNSTPPAEATAAPKTTSKPLTRAQRLAAALKACKKDKRKAKRAKCQMEANRKYGAKPKAKRGKR